MTIDDLDKGAVSDALHTGNGRLEKHTRSHHPCAQGVLMHEIGSVSFLVRYKAERSGGGRGGFHGFCDWTENDDSLVDETCGLVYMATILSSARESTGQPNG